MPRNNWLKQRPSGLLLYVRGVHHRCATNSYARSISPNEKIKRRQPMWQLLLRRKKNRVYESAITKRGVVSSNQLYRTHSLRGEYRARGTRDTWRRLEV